jgi:hypothetical protein
MQARSEPSIAPYFVRGDMVSVVTKNLFVRGQPHGKLRDRQLESFTIEQQIGKYNYRLRLPSKVRLHSVFHVQKLRPCSIASLRLAVSKNFPKGDDEKFDVFHISVVCI